MAGRVRFDWNEVRDIDWRERYFHDHIGSDLWRWIFEFEIGTEPWFTVASESLQRGRFSALDTTPARPCVFVSHRRNDYPAAVRMANILRNRIDKDIDVWLDVEDPDLQRLALQPDQQKLAVKVLTALVIEMALINSSHVLAILSRRTKGSMWLPYEYGRIKQGRALDIRAAMFQLDKTEPPEYALLGPVFSDPVELNAWP